MMNDMLCKVVDEFEENGMYDKINANFAEDNDGEYYVLVEDWEDLNKFVSFVKNTLQLPEDTKDYEIESTLEINLVFTDEYTTCDDCGHVIRTSPDSYGWQPDFFVGDGYIVCGKCFKDNKDYQEEYLQERINNPNNAINGIMDEDDLENLGFEKINTDSYENGWHHGQTDIPKEIYNGLNKKYKDIIFLVDSVEQFDIHFSAFCRGEIE